MKAECQRANSTWPMSFFVCTFCVSFSDAAVVWGYECACRFRYEFVVTEKREYDDDDNEFILLHLNLLVHKAMQQFNITRSLQYKSRHLAESTQPNVYSSHKMYFVLDFANQYIMCFSALHIFVLNFVFGISWPKFVRHFREVRAQQSETRWREKPI